MATRISTDKELIAALKSGESIHLHKGNYKGNFTSQLVKGVVGAEQGAVLEATGPYALTIKGRESTYQDFEIAKGGVYVHAPRTKLRNLVIHDTKKTAIGLWADAPDSEVSNCILYRNGSSGLDHAIYTQNKTGVHRITDNIMFEQAGYGVHVYGSNKSFLKGYHIEGNISFNNGLKLKSNKPNIHVGGGAPAGRIVIRNNFTYHRDRKYLDVRLGYPTLSDDFEATDNYCAGVLRVQNWKRIIYKRNTIVADHIEWITDKLGNHDWNKNSYYLRDSKPFWLTEKGKTRKLSFAEWRRQTAFDHDSNSYSETPPNKVFIRAVENGSHVIIYNWAKQKTVEVNLGGKLYNVENLAAPLVEGGNVPVGEFGCFVVRGT